VIITNLLNSILTIHDLGETGYGIPANAKNLDLSKIFTHEQLEYSMGIKTAQKNGWITVTNKKHTNESNVSDVSYNKVMPKVLRHKEIVENPDEMPQVITEKPLEDKKMVENIKETIEDSIKIDEANQEIQEIKDEKKLEELTWGELRTMAKEKGINLKQKKEEILKQLKG
jgi:hypothetical protein